MVSNKSHEDLENELHMIRFALTDIYHRIVDRENGNLQAALDAEYVKALAGNYIDKKHLEELRENDSAVDEFEKEEDTCGNCGEIKSISDGFYTDDDDFICNTCGDE